MEVITEILGKIGTDVESMEYGEYFILEREGFEDLIIEKKDDGYLSVMQYYLQNMDMMRDPEIVFDVTGDEWTPVMYENSPMTYRTSEGGLDGLDEFIETWNDNLRKQGFVEAAEDVETEAAA